MKGFAIAAACATLISSAAASIDPIVISGSKFFYKTNGTQFFIRGVAYQQDYGGNGSTTQSGSDNSYIDPLADFSSCSRDIKYMSQLRTNTIRVYAVDPTKNHDQCMNALANAGIYVIADLSAPDESINRQTPAWNTALYSRYASVIDAFSSYNNVIGFFAGNEVSNAPNNTDAAAFVKAAVRDMKSYIKTKQYRQMYVGYATSDDALIRTQMADYMNCGTQTSAVDFWGYNIYSWCGDSTYQESGYADRTKEFSTYSVPSFFAEYGCNTIQPRTFSEVDALYGSQMTSVWSGGIVYMYFQEANDYGLVQLNSGSNTVSLLPDFTALSSRLAGINPTGVNSASYKPTNSPAACPSEGSSFGAKATPLPPTPNADLCNCMYNSLGCVVTQGTSSENYDTLFGTVCGYGNACNGIEANSSTGTYGAYGMCPAAQQLAYAFNAYYLNQNGASDACSFSGAASIKASTSASGSCATLINEAGTAGTGVVTSQPSGTGAAEAGSGGSGGSASSSSKAAAADVSVHHVRVGALSAAVYLSVAILSGAAMIML